ncbi:MAG: 1,4-dihydroxy-2-naphthoate polyprenyltransferase, partial [Propionibacteriaceae bacterium]|nr:1,4-dihydroxy-2-naphthoate polyprenyltransferase [Propionibacteriaceae bacterium]
MATAAEWVEGARLRTLPAAISPVVAGSGIAWWEHSFNWLLAILALVVALAVQVGSNLANDYSDGI